MSQGQRSFTGFSFAERVSADDYGERYRGQSAAGREVRILEIARDLSDTPGFAEALTRYGTELGLLQHRNVVSTVSVGRGDAGQLVVVTEPIGDAVSVAELLDDTDPQGLPAEMALAISLGVVRAITAAHKLNILHGAIHPRSVWVSPRGDVKLGDFAVGRALAVAAARSQKPKLLRGMRGFVAPELALGDEPSPQSDIYGAGSLLFTMLAGEVPPARLKTTRTLGRILNRALDTDLNARFQYAKAMLLALEQLIESGAGTVASAEQLGEFVRDVHAIATRASSTAASAGSTLGLGAASDLDDETEDLLASLDLGGGDPDEVGTTVDGPRRRTSDSREALPPPPSSTEMDDLLAELDSDASPSPKGPDLGLGAARPTPNDFGGGGDSTTLDGDQPTRVDDRGPTSNDPISALIRLDPDDEPTREVQTEPPVDPKLDEFDESTPLPRPLAAHEIPGSVTRSGPEILEGTGRRNIQAAAADAAIASLEEEQEVAPRPRPRTAAPPVVDSTDMLLHKRGLPGWVWLALTVAVLGALGWFLWTKTDVFHPERAQAKRDAAEKRRLAALQAFQNSQPKPGTISIASEPTDAAVWLKLGRAPLDSMELPTKMIHELRVSHEGYQTKDVRVTGSSWVGEGKGARAAVSVELVTGADKKLAAAPPEPPASASEGLKPGSGIIHVETKPAGAEVWLLVGFTHDFRPLSIQAGKGYELKVLKDGHRPGYVVIRPEDWATETPGTLHTQLERSVELAPLGKPN